VVRTSRPFLSPGTTFSGPLSLVKRETWTKPCSKGPRCVVSTARPIPPLGSDPGSSLAQYTWRVANAVRWASCEPWRDQDYRGRNIAQTDSLLSHYFDYAEAELAWPKMNFGSKQVGSLLTPGRAAHVIRALKGMLTRCRDGVGSTESGTQRQAPVPIEPRSTSLRSGFDS
jgi:hypothetical protein